MSDSEKRMPETEAEAMTAITWAIIEEVLDRFRHVSPLSNNAIAGYIISEFEVAGLRVDWKATSGEMR